MSMVAFGKWYDKKICVAQDVCLNDDCGKEYEVDIKVKCILDLLCRELQLKDLERSIDYIKEHLKLWEEDLK